jgi:hypothetical protein
LKRERQFEVEVEVITTARESNDRGFVKVMGPPPQ